MLALSNALYVPGSSLSTSNSYFNYLRIFLFLNSIIFCIEDRNESEISGKSSITTPAKTSGEHLNSGLQSNIQNQQYPSELYQGQRYQQQQYQQYPYQQFQNIQEKPLLLPNQFQSSWIMEPEQIPVQQQPSFYLANNIFPNAANVPNVSPLPVLQQQPMPVIQRTYQTVLPQRQWQQVPVTPVLHTQQIPVAQIPVDYSMVQDSNIMPFSGGIQRPTYHDLLSRFPEQQRTTQDKQSLI